jgi:hypothetical protein
VRRAPAIRPANPKNEMSIVIGVPPVEDAPASRGGLSPERPLE